MLVIYPPGSDMTSGGTILTPISAVIEQEANAVNELTVVHLRDDDGRWRQIVPGAVIDINTQRMGIPLKKLEGTTTEYYKSNGIRRTVTKYHVEVVWVKSGAVWKQTTVSTPYTETVYDPIPLYSDAGWTKVLTKIPKGDKLTLIDNSINGVLRVTTAKGQIGYVKVSQVTLSGSTTDWSEIDVGAMRETQLYRVYKVEKKAPGTVTAYARHVFFDAEAYCAHGDTQEGVTVAVALGFLPECGIHFYTNEAEKTVDYKPGDGRTVTEIVKDIADQADLQIIMDGFSAYLLAAGTYDRYVELSTGRNIKTLTFAEDISDVITRYVPLIGDSKTEGTAIDSEHIGDYPIPRMEYVKADSQAEAEEEARKKYDDGVDLPKRSLDVSFVDTDCVVFDMLHVRDPRLDINVTAQCVRTTYDCLARRVTSAEAGDTGMKMSVRLFEAQSGTWQNVT